MDLPSDYERRVSNGALVIFGQNAVQTLEGLREQGHLKNNLAICSVAASDLALPNTLMVWAILIFAHFHPAIRNRGSTRDELQRWHHQLLEGVSFAGSAEPSPRANLTGNEEDPGILLQLDWLPPREGPWNGVHSDQVKRVASLLERAYERASGEIRQVGQSNYDRAYLMALSSWKLFGHTSEPAEMFARRIAEIGLSQGLSAAAEAVAEDCRQHGLEMSGQPVLKSLSFNLERHRDLLSTLTSIEQFPIDELGKKPPGIEGLFATTHKPEVEKKSASSSIVGAVILILVLIAIGWLIFR